MKRLVFIFFTFLVLLFLGCSTSRGTLFRDTYESDKGKDSFQATTSPSDDDDEDVPSYPVDDDEYVEAEGLSITSYPGGASVYLNHQYYGTTPVWIPDLITGNYVLEIEYPGYYPHKEWIYYPGGYMKYSASLNPVTGYLHVSVSLPDATIYLDKEEIQQGVTEHRIGSYYLSVRKFGYNDYYKTVTIEENKTTSVEVVLEEADFSIMDPGVSRKIFNPRNPGTLGETEIFFRVTSFGTGTVTITDTTGSKMFSYSFPGFQTWHQYCTWNGRTGEGALCPDGEYTINIKAVSEKDRGGHSLSTSVRIDSSIAISYRSMWSGTTGLMYSCTPDILPALSFQISTLFAVHFEEYLDHLILRAPAQIGLRFGAGWNIEADISTMVILTDADVLPYTVSTALKYRLFKTRSTFSLQSAAYVKGSFHYGTGADTMSNYTGISLGIPFQASVGYFSFIVNPELILSPYRVTYTPDYDADPALTMWGYGRFGILFEYGLIITGISGAIRTTPFWGHEAFGIHYPLLGAYELHVMVPKSNLYFSCVAAAEYASIDNFYIMGGFGLGFIY